jgi:hypothetical protein
MYEVSSGIQSPYVEKAGGTYYQQADLQAEQYKSKDV